MSQTVTVNCPQGIQSLVALGRNVALSKAFGSHPRSAEAFVGLWLGNALALADLRDRVEVVGGEARAEVAALPWTGDSDEAAVGRVLHLFQEGVAQLESKLVRESGQATPSNLSLSVVLPPDTGLAAGVLMAIVAIGVAIPTAGYVSTKVIDWWREKSRNNTAVDIMGTCSARAQEIGETAREQNRPLSDAERQELATCERLGEQAIKNLTAARPGTGLFGDLNPSTLVLAAAALAAVFFLTRK